MSSSRSRLWDEGVELWEVAESGVRCMAGAG